MKIEIDNFYRHADGYWAFDIHHPRDSYKYSQDYELIKAISAALESAYIEGKIARTDEIEAFLKRPNPVS
jgi:hypothetical protein